MENKDHKSEVILRNRDLRPYAPELFGQELEQFLKLKVLKLEHCELEYFTPKKSIPGLKELSLEGNRISELNTIIFSKEKEPS